MLLVILVTHQGETFDGLGIIQLTSGKVYEAWAVDSRTSDGLGILGLGIAAADFARG